MEGLQNQSCEPSWHCSGRRSNDSETSPLEYKSLNGELSQSPSFAYPQDGKRGLRRNNSNFVGLPHTMNRNNISSVFSGRFSCFLARESRHPFHLTDDKSTSSNSNPSTQGHTYLQSRRRKDLLARVHKDDCSYTASNGAAEGRRGLMR
jgi:hypothetical protein